MWDDGGPHGIPSRMRPAGRGLDSTAIMRHRRISATSSRTTVAAAAAAAAENSAVNSHDHCSHTAVLSVVLVRPPTTL